MAAGSAHRLGLLAAGVLVLHLLVLQGWSPRAAGGGTGAPPGLTARLVPTAVMATPAPPPLPAVDVPAARPSHETVVPRPAQPQPHAVQDAAAEAAQATEALPGPPGATAPPATLQPTGVLAAASPRVAVPAPALWRYEVTGSARGQAVLGEASLEWQHDGHQYEARMDWGGEGLPARSHRSSGRLAADGLQPRRFAERQRTELATHMDAEAGRIVFSNNQAPQALQPGQQDRLSLLMQLAAVVGGDPARHPPGTRLSIPTATARGAEPWLLEVTGEEDLVLAGTVVRTLKIERRPAAAHDQRLEIWLAPAAGHAPVRLRVTQAGGDWLDQRWRAPDGR